MTKFRPFHISVAESLTFIDSSNTPICLSCTKF